MRASLEVRPVRVLALEGGGEGAVCLCMHVCVCVCVCVPSSRYAQTEAQKGYEYSTSSATYAVKPGGN